MAGAAAGTETFERFELESGLVGYRSPTLAQLGVPHVFTTRHDGGGLSLEVDGRDGAEAGVRRLCRLAARDAGSCANRRPVRVRQVHGATLCRVEGELPEPLPEADALVTERADRLLIVRVADCVPVLLAARDGRSVAAVHAGWRGLVAGVLPRTLEAFRAREVVAAIGPSISREHFEVGPEVVEAFESAGLIEVAHEVAGSQCRIDLRAAARLQLERAGLETIDVTACCTWRDGEDFYSYRRDVTRGGAASTGRMGAVIGVALSAAGPGTRG